MKPLAIVYTSNTGHTARYAAILSEKTGLPCYSAKEATKHLQKETPVLYLGWLFANHVKGYRKAAKRYELCAVCGVGLCPTGALLRELRETEKLPTALPLFTVQGGMDQNRLKGLYRSMIRMLIKMLQKKENKTEEEQGMLALLEAGGDHVSESNLADVLEWYENA